MCLWKSKTKCLKIGLSWKIMNIWIMRNGLILIFVTSGWGDPQVSLLLDAT